eukprot:6488975-Amphidinium_carterae.1
MEVIAAHVFNNLNLLSIPRSIIACAWDADGVSESGTLRLAGRRKVCADSVACLAQLLWSPLASPDSYGYNVSHLKRNFKRLLICAHV